MGEAVREKKLERTTAYIQPHEIFETPPPVLLACA